MGNKVFGTDDLWKLFKPLYLWLITSCIKSNTRLNKKQRVNVNSCYCSWRIFLLMSSKGLSFLPTVYFLMEADQGMWGKSFLQIMKMLKRFVIENNTKEMITDLTT